MPIAPAGRPPPSALASVTMSGCTPKRSAAPPGGDRQAGLDLVEDQDDAVAAGDLAHRLEVALARAGRGRRSSWRPP